MSSSARPIPEALLFEVLERSRGLGFLGPGPIASHVAHARRYLDAVDAYRRTRIRNDGALHPQSSMRRVRVIDLGAGGGVPSLPMLALDGDIDVLLVDAAQRRTSFCAWALATMGVSERARVWTGRAEALAADETVGGLDVRTHDVAVARGFGPPASTLECAAPLIRLGGWCVISEPPGGRHWPREVPELGLHWVPGHESVAVFERRETVAEGFPRSAKAQKRKPLFML